MIKLKSEPNTVAREPSNSRGIVLAAIPVALFLVIVSGKADKIIFDLFCNMLTSCSDTALRDYKQVGVLITFIIGITGFASGALLKNYSPYAIVAGLFTIVFIGVAALWGTVPDGLNVPEKLRSLTKSLYISLVIFTAALLPVIAISENNLRRTLPHVYLLLALSLLISLFTGFAIQGLTELAWPETSYRSVAGTSKFVITPAAVIICTATWGALLTHPFYYPHKWDKDRGSRTVWCTLFATAGILFAYGYGHFFLFGATDSPREWIALAKMSKLQAGYVAMALLLPAMLIVFAKAVVIRSGSKAISELIYQILIVTIAHAVSALYVVQYLKRGKGGRYPLSDVDIAPFVLAHMLSGIAGLLTLLLVHFIMRKFSTGRLRKIESTLNP